MRSLVCCAVFLACASCATADEPSPTRRSTDAVARQVAASERDNLRAWCAEDGRAGSDVALRMADAREDAGEPVDISCDEIQSGGDEPVGSAEEPLTPIGLACGAAIVTLVAGSFKFCHDHPRVKNCEVRWAAGSTGLGLACTIFF